MDEMNVWREDEKKDNPEKVEESTDDWMASTEAHGFSPEEEQPSRNSEDSFLQKNRTVLLLLVIIVIIIASFAIIFI